MMALCSGSSWIVGELLQYLLPWSSRLIHRHTICFLPCTFHVHRRSISWNSHPSEVLPEPPSLPDSPTKGCCDWTEVSLSSCVSLPHGKLSRFPSCIFLAHSFKVLAYGLRGCRDFIPAAGLTYSECCIFNFHAALKGFLFAPLLIGNWEKHFEGGISQKIFSFFSEHHQSIHELFYHQDLPLLQFACMSYP